jgi:hypothetical protein
LSQSGQEKKSKEFKLEPKLVITPEQVLSSDRIVKLLYLLEAYGEISEKACYHFIYELKQRGLDIGYTFFKLGDSVSSKQLREDITSLLYLELLETKGRAKKLVVTSKGKEELSKRLSQLPEDFKEKASKLVEEVRPVVASIDAESEYKQIKRK